MVATSWVLHCGSEHRSAGLDSTNFTLNIPQQLEFGEDARCSLANVCIPNTFPNVSDSHKNRTWTFKFEYYATPFTRTVANTNYVPYHTYTKSGTNDLISSYDLVVKIPEGFYANSYDDESTTSASYVPQIADAPFALEDIGMAGVVTGVDFLLESNGKNKMRSELLLPQHVYGASTPLPNKTYVQALYKAIASEQLKIRKAVIDSAVSTKLVELDIIKLLVSDLLIVPIVNKYHQIEFLIRANFCNNSGTGSTRGSSIRNILGNKNYATDYSGAAYVKNPWMYNADVTGAPTNQLYCRIDAPEKVAFNGMSATNCLDFYNFGYNQLASDAGSGVQLLSGDYFKTGTGPCSSSAVGNFTPYGNTWSTHSLLRSSTDSFKVLNRISETGDFYFCVATWGVKAELETTPTPDTVEQACYMYLPSDFSGTASMVLVTGVECNRYSNSAYVQYGSLSKYPATAGSTTNRELVSTVFTGTTVRVSPNQIPANEFYLGPENLTIPYASITPIQLETPVVFNIEVDMFGVSNHMMFTGLQEVRRVKLLKRMVATDNFGGYIRSNEEGHEVIDYGTKNGFTRVNDIRVRVLDMQGNVINAAYFPEWYFTLVFEY